MIDLLILHAAELLTCRTAPEGAIGPALRDLEIIPDGALAVDGANIMAVGTTAEIGARFPDARQIIDASGKLVTPGLVDPHSHLLHGGSRHAEYETIITGERHPGRKLDGGIRYTVRKTREASDEALTARALADLDIMLQHGTTTVEAKSGYGLNAEQEQRLVRLAAGLRHPVEVVNTYMAAHVVPEEYLSDRDGYVNLVLDGLEQARPYAEFCDVFCDAVGFTLAETERILTRAVHLGYRIKLHADQTAPYQASALAAQFRATSADHLDYITPDDMARLAAARTVGVLLPGVTFHMAEMTPKVDPESGDLLPAEKPFWPHLVRQMIRAGMRLALSADYNPGSCNTPNMQIIMQLAARLYRLNYAEIWHMSTINAAHALDRGTRIGSLEAGKQADVLIWRVPEHGMVINRFGVNLVEQVMKAGQIVVR